MALAPGTFLAPVPVFPLPEITLFPRAVLPLHIFEPRYRVMIEDALSGERRIVMAQIQASERRDLHGHPPFERVGGLGRITEHQRLPDGRFHLLLEGEARVQVEELPFDPPYRRVRATVLGDAVGPVPTHDVSALVAVASRWMARAARRGNTPALPDATDPAGLADFCAQHLLLSGPERQRVLETLDTPARVRLCTEYLAVQEALNAPARVLN